MPVNQLAVVDLANHVEAIVRAIDDAIEVIGWEKIRTVGNHDLVRVSKKQADHVLIWFCSFNSGSYLL